MTSVIQLYGSDFTPHHCGYCDTDGSISYGMNAVSLTPLNYQKLIDRGWRRSGCYLYKPEMERTCCKLYTIRLDSHKYTRSKSHKKTMKKMEKYINGQSTKEMDVDEPEEKNTKDASTSQDQPMEELKKHKLEITVVRAQLTDESFQVYKQYQMSVHEDPEEKLNELSYKRFLVDSPLVYQKGPTADHPGYGSFHRHYRIDGKLVAVGVIDILPYCVSSVYFYYDPSFSFLSLGVYSAISEIDYAKELSKIDPQLRYYYLGFYAHNCPKMNYKAQYRPSDLLDYVNYKWFPLSDCVPLIEKSSLARFDPSREDQSETHDLKKVPLQIGDGQILKLEQLKFNNKLIQLIAEYAKRVGPELATQMVLRF